jgi:hypothetical protein
VFNTTMMNVSKNALFFILWASTQLRRSQYRKEYLCFHTSKLSILWRLQSYRIRLHVVNTYERFSGSHRLPLPDRSCFDPECQTVW